MSSDPCDKPSDVVDLGKLVKSHLELLAEILRERERTIPENIENHKNEHIKQFKAVQRAFEQLKRVTLEYFRNQK